MGIRKMHLMHEAANRQPLVFVLIGLCVLVSGCAPTDTTSPKSESPPVMRAEPSDEPDILLPSELRRQLKANENAKFERVGNDIVEARLFQSGVKSIDALKGLPLRFLDLGMTEVSDLSPIKGMPLQTLILENTPVDDISVVEGMKLEVLHLQNTKVTDLSVLKGMPIRELNLVNVAIKDLSAVAQLPLDTLWVPRTGVTDLTPLQGKPMISLDIEATKVESLEPLAGMTSLQRLNIAGTPVQDISPLKGLNLQRITLTPENIKSGMDVLRDMPSLSQIQTTMEGPRQSASEFWTKFDAGVWQVKDSADDTDKTDTKPATKSDDASAKAGEDNPVGDSATTPDAGEKEETDKADTGESAEKN